MTYAEFNVTGDKLNCIVGRLGVIVSAISVHWQLHGDHACISLLWF